MAKKIRITAAETDEMIAELRRKFRSGMINGTVTFTHSFTDTRRATLSITPTAWAKMKILVMGYTTEVQWHGTVERTGEASWLIKDILNFPHTVSAAHVESDLDAFNEWEDQLPIETQKEIRFHGHSHVNMGVNPSGDDMTFRYSRVSMMPEASEDFDPYYIFMILNKKGELSCQIYDKANNALYDTDDIDIDYTGGDESLAEFLAESKSMTKPAVPATYVPAYKSYYTTPGKYPAGAGTYTGSYYRSRDYNDYYDNYGGYDNGSV